MSEKTSVSLNHDLPQRRETVAPTNGPAPSRAENTHMRMPVKALKQKANAALGVEGHEKPDKGYFNPANTQQFFLKKHISEERRPLSKRDENLPPSVP